MKWMHFGLTATLLGTSAPLFACLGIGAGGRPVFVTSETALIVWNATEHVEHFIRTANFSTEADDMGFLVPTPSVPTLSEIDKRAFGFGMGMVRLHQRTSWVDDLGNLGCGSARAAAKGGVSILGSYQVGGYKATILSATDPSSLTNWLHQNNYETNARTTDWLAPYVKDHWTITAFKIDGEGKYTNLRPVDLSFRTDKPFYPYREPLQPAESKTGRTLRVMFLSDSAMEGEMDGEKWTADIEASDQLKDTEAADLGKLLKGVHLPSHVWLTSFYDKSEPRHGTGDVYFIPETSFKWTPVLPFAAVIGIYFWQRRRKAAMQGDSAAVAVQGPA